MDELNDDIIRTANDACSYLESKIMRLRSVVTNAEAESLMNEVANYEFPQINCDAIFTPLVRCIKIDKKKEKPSSITQMKRFSSPPTRCVKKPGRMNIPEVPTFYAADKIETSLVESDITEGDEFYIGIWSVDNRVSMLSYPCIPYDILRELSARGDVKAMEMKNCIDLFPCIRRMTDLIGKVFSIPHDEKSPFAENKYIYYLSGAIAHSILNQQKMTKNGIYQTDAIIYPSVKMLGSTYNLAIRPDFVKQHMKLLYVVKGKLNEGQITYSFDYLGFNENGTIIWKQMCKRIKELKITMIRNKSGIHSPHPNETIRFEGKNYTIPMFESYEYEQLKNQNSPLKVTKFDKEDNIDIMDLAWVRKWEEDTEQYLELSLGNGCEVQMKATINSYFSTDGVESEMVFGYNAD
ncbi:MAG: RES family NAD+ phosphorylase [Bacteroidaceae bacterium]|nr:RES family NAD+ phosphorylase [Bacteroidaceae bacterium]